MGPLISGKSRLVKYYNLARFTGWWNFSHIFYFQPYPMTNPWDERYIYVHQWLIFMVNVGKYTIHGCYRYFCIIFFKGVETTSFIFFPKLPGHLQGLADFSILPMGHVFGLSTFAQKCQVPPKTSRCTRWILMKMKLNMEIWKPHEFEFSQEKTAEQQKHRNPSTPQSWSGGSNFGWLSGSTSPTQQE